VAADLSDSLYQTWADRFGQQVARIEDRVGLAPFPDWTPTDVPFAAAAPAGLAERRTWGADGALFEFSGTWFDSARARFVTRDGGDRWHAL
jgi:GntR family transcriptional regulator